MCKYSYLMFEVRFINSWFGLFSPCLRYAMMCISIRMQCHPLRVFATCKRGLGVGLLFLYVLETSGI